MRELAPEVIIPEEGLDDTARRYQEQLGMQLPEADPEAQAEGIDDRQSVESSPEPEVTPTTEPEAEPQQSSEPEEGERKEEPQDFTVTDKRKVGKDSTKSKTDQEAPVVLGADKRDERRSEQSKDVSEKSEVPESIASLDDKHVKELTDPNAGVETMRATLSFDDNEWSALKGRRAQIARNEKVEVADQKMGAALDARREKNRTKLERAAEQGNPVALGTATAPEERRRDSEPHGGRQERSDISPELAERMHRQGIKPEAIDALMRTVKESHVSKGVELAYGFQLHGSSEKINKEVTNKAGKTELVPTVIHNYGDMELDSPDYQMLLGNLSRESDSLGREGRKRLRGSGVVDPYTAQKSHHLNTLLKHMVHDENENTPTLEGEELYDHVVSMMEDFGAATEKGKELLDTPLEGKVYKKDDEVAVGGLKRLFNRFRRNNRDKNETPSDDTEESTTEEQPAVPENESPRQQAKRLRSEARTQKREARGKRREAMNLDEQAFRERAAKIGGVALNAGVLGYELGEKAVRQTAHGLGATKNFVSQTAANVSEGLAEAKDNIANAFYDPEYEAWRAARQQDRAMNRAFRSAPADAKQRLYEQLQEEDR